MGVLDRITRRANLIGGPSDGRTVPVPLPDDHPWPLFQCIRLARDEWRHYVYIADGRYEYMGVCAEIDHEGGDPHDHVCCCGREGCDGTGPWP